MPNNEEQQELVVSKEETLEKAAKKKKVIKADKKEVAEHEILETNDQVVVAQLQQPEDPVIHNTSLNIDTLRSELISTSEAVNKEQSSATKTRSRYYKNPSNKGTNKVRLGGVGRTRQSYVPPLFSASQNKDIFVPNPNKNGDGLEDSVAHVFNARKTRNK